MGKCKAKAIQTDLGTFSHNQAYSNPYVNLAYYEPSYIQNSWHIQNQKHIQNPGMFRTPVYWKL